MVNMIRPTMVRINGFCRCNLLVFSLLIRVANLNQQGAFTFKYSLLVMDS